MNRSALHRIMKPSPQPWTVSSVLDHGFGEVVYADDARSCLRIASYYFLEGPLDPAAAEAVVARLGAGAVLTTSRKDWRNHLLSRPELAATLLPRRRYVWTEGAGRLAAFLQTRDPSLAVKPIGAAEAARIEALPWAEGVFDAYADTADFLARGFGSCVTRGAEVLSLCLSFSTSNYGVEIEVDTDPAWHGRGLAKIASAHFVMEALRRDVAPLWDASNEPSAKLAAAIGFRLDGEYEAVAVPDPEAP